MTFLYFFKQFLYVYQGFIIRTMVKHLFICLILFFVTELLLLSKLDFDLSHYLKVRVLVFLFFCYVVVNTLTFSQSSELAAFLEDSWLSKLKFKYGLIIFFVSTWLSFQLPIVVLLVTQFYFVYSMSYLGFFIIVVLSLVSHFLSSLYFLLFLSTKSNYDLSLVVFLPVMIPFYIIGAKTLETLFLDDLYILPPIYFFIFCLVIILLYGCYLGRLLYKVY